MHIKIHLEACARVRECQRRHAETLRGAQRHAQAFRDTQRHADAHRRTQAHEAARTCTQMHADGRTQTRARTLSSKQDHTFVQFRPCVGMGAAHARAQERTRRCMLSCVLVYLAE